MDKKKIEYIIIAIAICLLVYASYFFITYHYLEKEITVDSITLLAPTSSEYSVEGNTIVFKNMYSIYNLNITKTNSSDKRAVSLINYYSNFKIGGIEYLNEDYYVLNTVYDDNGHAYHSIILPIDSFNKDEFSFNNETTVWIFDGNNKEFVMDSALHTRGLA